MKRARLLLNKAGLPVYLVVIMFSLAESFILLPAMGFIWRLTLMTTPEGFISNANIKITLLKSPWVILVGLFLVSVFLLFNIWQVSATVIGVGYAYEGKTPKVIDLIKISIDDIFNSAKPKNWMLILYICIILPFSNMFQASDMIGAFVIPEYIDDFIHSKTSLLVLYAILMIAAIYLALRWIYVIPSFYLKNHDFHRASKESLSFTKKGKIKTLFRLFIYGIIESVRLAVIPILILAVVCAIAYLSVKSQPYAKELFMDVILNFVNDIYNSVCGVMVYLSVMCFIVEEYLSNCERENENEPIKLPELNREAKHYISGKQIQIWAGFIGALITVAAYLLLVFAASVAPEIMDEFAYNPTIVAHKGYSSRAPENTMDAFKLADETEKADFIELDVWSSKDGIPVVIHNETIFAATGREGCIYDFTYDELQEIPAPYAMDSAKFPNARIPKLEDVIKTYSKTTPLIIEIKGYSQDNKLPEKIVALMEKYDCTETSMIHSIDYAALKAVKMCNPDIKCGLIQAIITGNSYDLPYADFLSVEHSFINKNMIKQLHLRGKEVYAWTVNYESSVDGIRTLDIDGFITDYPDEIAEMVYSDLGIEDLIDETVPVGDFEEITAQSEFDAGNY